MTLCDVKKYLKEQGYNTKAKIKCKKGHRYNVSLNKIRKGGEKCPFILIKT